MTRTESYWLGLALVLGYLAYRLGGSTILCIVLFIGVCAATAELTYTLRENNSRWDNADDDPDD